AARDRRAGAAHGRRGWGRPGWQGAICPRATTAKRRAVGARAAACDTVVVSLRRTIWPAELTALFSVMEPVVTRSMPVAAVTPVAPGAQASAAMLAPVKVVMSRKWTE